MLFLVDMILFVKQLIFMKNEDVNMPLNVEIETICWNKFYACAVLWYPEDEVELIH